MGHFKGFFEGLIPFWTLYCLVCSEGWFWGQIGQGPLKKSQEMPHYMFCPRQEKKSRTFKIRVLYIGIFMSLREREKERERASERGKERGREQEGEREQKQELLCPWKRESKRERAKARARKGKGKTERENKSAGDYISKPPGLEWKIREYTVLYMKERCNMYLTIPRDSSLHTVISGWIQKGPGKQKRLENLHESSKCSM